jgi:mannose/cellobiose epimerase-like protein (N-acyl-D-glucosamine 2-epimerase family)
MEKTNQSKNKSTTYRVSQDTVAFMMASGFSPEGNWYQWAKKNGEAVDDR